LPKAVETKNNVDRQTAKVVFTVERCRHCGSWAHVGKRGAAHAEKPPDPNVRMVSEMDVMLSALEYADEYGFPVGFDASTAYYG
jgi:hypothetical protein